MLDTSTLPKSLVPRISRRERQFSRWVLALLPHWPERTRGSPPLSNHLRNVLGLPPLDPSRRYWDHE